MQWRLSLFWWQGPLCIVYCGASTIHEKACVSRGASTGGNMLLQKGVTHHRLPPEEAIPEPPERRAESAKVAAASQQHTALAAIVKGAVTSSNAAPKAVKGAAMSTKAATEAVTSAAMSSKSAPEAVKGAAPNSQAAPEVVKGAALSSKAAPEAATRAAPSRKAADTQATTNSGQHHHHIPAALFGPAAGQALMTHDAGMDDLGMIDKVAVGSLDFAATGGSTAYCKSWLRNHGFLCEFGAIFLGLLVCTPILALSVAAFWGIVTGLKSVNN